MTQYFVARGYILAAPSCEPIDLYWSNRETALSLDASLNQWLNKKLPRGRRRIIRRNRAARMFALSLKHDV